MSGFRVGVMAPTLAARPAADTLTRATYLDAAASRVDSFWVSDHINGLFPRSLWQPKTAAPRKSYPRSTHGWSRGRCSGTSPPGIALAASGWAWG